MILKYQLGKPITSPAGKYGLNGMPYDLWLELVTQTARLVAAQTAATKNALITSDTRTSQQRAEAKRQGDRHAAYEEKQRLTQEGLKAIGTLGTFARPSTWIALPFRGIEHFGKGFGTEWVNTPVDFATPWAWSKAVQGVKAAGTAMRNALGRTNQNIVPTVPLVYAKSFIHPAEAVAPGTRRSYIKPQSSGWRSVYTREPIMTGEINIPEGAKIVGEFKGEPMIEFNGKRYLLSKFNELHGKPSLGYDPKLIAEEAKTEFNDPIMQRLISTNRTFEDIATRVENGESTTRFATGRRTLINPTARNVFTGELLDIVEEPTVRGVGLVNTSPAKGVSVLGNKYIGRGNFGQNSFSITNTRRASKKYGNINYDEVDYHLSKNQLLSLKEKNEGLKITKRLREIEKKEFDSSRANTQGNIKFSTPEEEIEYYNLLDRLNKLIPGIFDYGGKNRLVLFKAPKELQILDILSESDKFGDQAAKLGLQLRDFRGNIIESYTPTGNIKSGDFSDILDAERTVGGYFKESGIYGRQPVKGWNLSEKVMELLRLKYPYLFPSTIPKNYRFYVRGTGPNGVPGETNMITLQAPNGGVPSFKFGKKLNFKLINKSKNK